jgi:hypothetical protein
MLGDLQILFARLLDKISTFPEAPATDHFGTGFLGFTLSLNKYLDGTQLKLLLHTSHVLNQNFEARVSSQFFSRI